jgi:hypothetical protein
MTVQSDLADWLAKLLRLACCETAPDGERLAALNRLSATVAAHDVDWDAALSGFNEEQLRRVFDEGYQRGHADGRQQAHPARDWTPAAGTSAEAGSDAKRIWAIVEASERAIGLSLLSDWEITFLNRRTILQISRPNVCQPKAMGRARSTRSINAPVRHPNRLGHLAQCLGRTRKESTMNVNDLYPSRYLKASDLGGVPHVLKILRIEVQDIGNPQKPDRKPVMYFADKEKRLVSNKTKALAIAARFGPDMGPWIGKDIEMFSTIVSGPSGPVEGIRVRPVEQAAAQPTPQAATGTAQEAVFN